MKAIICLLLLLSGRVIFAQVPPPPGSPNQSPSFPSSIYAPFYGQGKLSSSRSPTGSWKSSDRGWKEDVGSNQHKKFVNSAFEFDDSNAYDFNIVGDMDQGLPVLAVADGKVISLGSTFVSGGVYGAVLIDHGSWVSGYMHMKNIGAPIGMNVKKGQAIGYIANIGPQIPNHLHFAAYAKVRKDIKDTKGKITYRWDLVSKRVDFVPVPLRLSPIPSSSSNPPAFPVIKLKVGQVAQIDAWTPWGVNLGSTSATSNTFWVTQNAKVVTVDGNGRVKGLTKGQTNVVVSYCGDDFIFPLTVQ